MQHDEWQVKENISQLKMLMSDQNLQLLPDYEQRVMVLKELGFIDENCRVQLKGKVACEVRIFRDGQDTGIMYGSANMISIKTRFTLRMNLS